MSSNGLDEANDASELPYQLIPVSRAVLNAITAQRPEQEILAIGDLHIASLQPWNPQPVQAGFEYPEPPNPGAQQEETEAGEAMQCDQQPTPQESQAVPDKQPVFDEEAQRRHQHDAILEPLLDPTILGYIVDPATGLPVVGEADKRPRPAVDNNNPFAVPEDTSGQAKRQRAASEESDAAPQKPEHRVPPADVSELNEQYMKAQADLSKAREELTKVTVEMYEEQENLVSELCELKDEKEKFEQNAKDQILGLESDLANADDLLKVLKKETAVKHEHVKQLEQETATMRRQMDEAESKFTNLRAENDQLRAILQRQAQEMQKLRGDFESHAAHASREVERGKSALWVAGIAYKQQMATMEQQIASLKQQLAARTSDLDDEVARHTQTLMTRSVAHEEYVNALESRSKTEAEMRWLLEEQHRAAEDKLKAELEQGQAAWRSLYAVCKMQTGHQQKALQHRLVQKRSSPLRRLKKQASSLKKVGAERAAVTAVLQTKLDAEGLKHQLEQEHGRRAREEMFRQRSEREERLELALVQEKARSSSLQREHEQALEQASAKHLRTVQNLKLQLSAEKARCDELQKAQKGHQGTAQAQHRKELDGLREELAIATAYLADEEQAHEQALEKEGARHLQAESELRRKLASQAEELKAMPKEERRLWQGQMARIQADVRTLHAKLAQGAERERELEHRLKEACKPLPTQFHNLNGGKGAEPGARRTAFVPRKSLAQLRAECCDEAFEARRERAQLRLEQRRIELEYEKLEMREAYLSIWADGEEGEGKGKEGRSSIGIRKLILQSKLDAVSLRLSQLTGP